MITGSKYQLAMGVLLLTVKYGIVVKCLQPK